MVDTYLSYNIINSKSPIRVPIQCMKSLIKNFSFAIGTIMVSFVAKYYTWVYGFIKRRYKV